MREPLFPEGRYLLDPECFHDIYGPEEKAVVSRHLVIPHEPLAPSAYFSTDTVYPDVRIIMSSWGMVPLDEIFFERFPRMEAILYAAGSIKPFATDLAWERGVRISSAVAANAVPVSEFTFSQILCALKQVWQYSLYARKHRRFRTYPRPPGAYRTTVGLISLGLIGRLVAERLKILDVRVIAYDPFFSPEDARDLGVTLCSLEEVFAESEVVSCHAPLLPETQRILGRRHFASMKPSASFINTARGAIVNEAELIEVLEERPDLLAILDVTEEEPPAEHSPLYRLDNVVLTPHIAGSVALERRRMGACMVEELGRLLRGEPLRHEIVRERLSVMA